MRYCITRHPAWPEFTLSAESPEALCACLRGIGVEDKLEPNETSMKFTYRIGVTSWKATMDRRIAQIRDWALNSGHTFQEEETKS
jgi:hypothetical protein